MFEMLIKSLGMEPQEFKEKFGKAFDLVNGFDARLKRIEEKLGIDEKKAA